MEMDPNPFVRISNAENRAGVVGGILGFFGGLAVVARHDQPIIDAEAQIDQYQSTIDAHKDIIKDAHQDVGQPDAQGVQVFVGKKSVELEHKQQILIDSKPDRYSTPEVAGIFGGVALVGTTVFVATTHIVRRTKRAIQNFPFA